MRQQLFHNFSIRIHHEHLGFRENVAYLFLKPTVLLALSCKQDEFFWEILSSDAVMLEVSDLLLSLLWQHGSSSQFALNSADLSCCCRVTTSIFFQDRRKRRRKKPHVDCIKSQNQHHAVVEIPSSSLCLPPSFLSSFGGSIYWNNWVLCFVKPSPLLCPPPLSPMLLRGKPRLAKPCKHTEESPYQQHVCTDLPTLLH